MRQDKAYIFDLDGVIVFTDKLHYKAWSMIADELGIYFDGTINNRLRGVSRADSLDIILSEGKVSLDQAKKDELLEKKNNAYRQFLKSMTPADVTDEVRHSLHKLKEDGCKIAIGSSSKNTKTILKQVDLMDIWDAIADGEDVTKSKPDPEVFLCAAGKLQVKPESCIVLEDAYAGIDAAKAGGMIAVGIGDAAGYDKADYHIDHFSQILDI